MPLTGTGPVMAQLIVAELATAGLFPTPESQVAALQRWTGICNRLIEHVVSTAQVVIPPGAVAVATAGTATAQTGSNPAPVIGSLT